MLKLHDPAPEFTLASTSGKDVSISDLRGKRVVLYFYPKDDTPGCTRESCGFRDNLARVKSRGAIVLGVSRDTLASHAKFKSKYDLPFELLSDPDAVVGKAYGAFGKKMMYGKPVVGTIRSTFLIDENGRIGAIWSPVRVDGHVDAVLAALADLAGGERTKPSAPRPATAKTKAKPSAATKAKRPAAVKAGAARGKAAKR